MIHNERGMTLPELVVGLSIVATIALVISTMLFGGFSMLGKNSEDMYLGSYFKKEYNEFRKEIKESQVICMNGADTIVDTTTVMCGNPNSDTELTDNKTIYLLNSSNEEIYYKFENNQLIRYNKSEGTNGVYMHDIDGSFIYDRQDLITLDVSFKNRNKEQMLEFSKFYISINQ